MNLPMWSSMRLCEWTLLCNPHSTQFEEASPRLTVLLCPWWPIPAALPRPPAPSPRQPPIRVRLCGATSRSWMVLVIWSLLTAILVGARWDLAAVWSVFPWWPVILGIFPGAYWSFINIWWSVELFCPFFFLSCFSSYWFFFFGIYVIYFLFSNYSWIRYSFVLVVGV